MSDVRVRKLQEFIKQEVSQMLMRGLKDPRIGFTTITDVHVTGGKRRYTYRFKACSRSYSYGAWQST